MGEGIYNWKRGISPLKKLFCLNIYVKKEPKQNYLTGKFLLRKGIYKEYLKRFIYTYVAKVFRLYMQKNTDKTYKFIKISQFHNCNGKLWHIFPVKII